MTDATNTNRYFVHTVTQTFNKVAAPHWVVDSTTNLPVDEFASKRAATLTARDLNRSATRTA